MEDFIEESEKKSTNDVNYKFIDLQGLNYYHKNLKNKFLTKMQQDIEDLQNDNEIPLSLTEVNSIIEEYEKIPK